MQALTRTITLPGMPYLRIIYRPSPENEPAKILSDFGAVLLKHAAKNDPLSQKLITAGKAFLVYLKDNRLLPFDSLFMGALEKVEMIRQALINPSSQKIFTDPWLVEGTVVWEKKELDEYRTFARQYAHKEINAASHDFAKDVIKWINLLPLVREEPVLALQEAGRDLALPQEVQNYQKYLQYELIIAQTIKLQQDLIEIKELEEMNHLLEAENIRIFGRFRNELAQQEQHHAQQNDEIRRGTTALKTQHQATIAVFNAADAQNRTTINRQQSQLEQNQIQMTAMQAQINSLSSQISSLYGQLGHLQDEVNNSGSSCSVM